MSVRKLKTEILELKRRILRNSLACSCRYVELTTEVPPDEETAKILLSNDRCLSENRVHVGFRAVTIGKLTMTVR